MVVCDQCRVGILRRSRGLLQVCQQVAVVVHRAQTRQVAGQARGQPNQRLGDESRAACERVVREEFEQVGQPAERLAPACRAGQGRAVVGSCHQRGVPDREPLRPGQSGPALHQGTQHQATARMGDHVDLASAGRQPRQQHARVLLGCAADHEVVEAEDAVTVGDAGVGEEAGAGERPEGAFRVRKGAVNENQGPLADRRRTRRELDAAATGCDAEPPLGAVPLSPDPLLGEASESRQAPFQRAGCYGACHLDDHEPERPAREATAHGPDRHGQRHAEHDRLLGCAAPAASRSAGRRGVESKSTGGRMAYREQRCLARRQLDLMIEGQQRGAPPKAGGGGAYLDDLGDRKALSLKELLREDGFQALSAAARG